MTVDRFGSIRQDSLLRYLRKQIAGEVRFDDTSKRLYATDASHYQIEPLGVVIPETLEDLVTVVQIASELGVSITPRGGGTSLSGQAIGHGIVIDCSKYLNQIGEVDTERRTVRVQPGVVLEHLNKALSSQGLQFGPDVATINRATLGGMIGNNSAGARSVIYGQTVDHVSALKVVLSDGKLTEFHTFDEVEHQQKLELPGREGDAYRQVQQVVQTQTEEIDRRFPKIIRKVSGYNLPGVVKNPRSLVPLLVGSEGTLAVVAEAELKLVPRPKHRGLLVPHFTNLRSALDAVQLCLEAKPSAVELMDKMLLELARTQRALSQTMAAIQGRPEALLMVEFFGESAEQVADQVEKLRSKLGGVNGLTACVPALDPALRDPLWALRGAAVPLLYGMPGDAKPVTFVEDCAVSPERMPEFATRFREIFTRFGTQGAFYGHASVGCLHIRPVLNLHESSDVGKMRQIMEQVTDLVLEFNGSLSGEHGDGLVRSEWNPKMFGPVITEAFEAIKKAFDPENIFNPGKIVHAPRMEENFRLAPGVKVADPPTVFDYSSQGGFFKSVELCNGAGVCRKTQGGAMCPSYRATKDEHDSTRGRANALRIAMTQPQPSRKEESPLAQRWLLDVMDLCLSCKACKTECPSNVDLTKLKAEFQEAYYFRRPRPVIHRLVKRIHTLSPFAANWAGMLNWLGRRGVLRWMLERLTGLDRRRSLPELHKQHFRSWFAEHPKPQGDVKQKVLLLDDCFTTFQEPQIGKKAVEVLERLGCEVELASICCGRAMISKGYLREAKQLAEQALPRLSQAAEQGIPILGLEPSCLLTLVDEWTELVPGEASKLVASRSEFVESWIAKRIAESGIEINSSVKGKVVLHPHCHQRALVGVSGTVSLLKQISGSELEVLDAGCCGMAGAFGYESRHYDLSEQIANLQLLPALATSPDATIVAPGTSCRHQIRDLTNRVALHPIELFEVAEPTHSAG
jgi:FAD/FMN-containing dehydrogenase/Fe-S oxidoreductase